MSLNHLSMKRFLLVCASFSLFITQYISFTAAVRIGVAYGTQGDNLPPPSQGLAKLQEVNVQKVRLFEPNHDALNYMNTAPFQVLLGTLDEDLPNLANDPNYATTWVNNNIVSYPNVTFSHIAVGNEIQFPSEQANSLPQALINLDAAIKSVKRTIPVSTVVSMNVLGASYPPSAGVFSDASVSIMSNITNFLQTNGYPLLLNVYPYFAYASDPDHIRLDYALFNTTDVVVQDGNLQYKNLFFAMIDSVYSALEKAGGANVPIVVAESGWPSAGNGDMATIEYAQMYNNNMIAAINSCGSPRKPAQALETYIFSMFNEDLKPEGVERNFGIYYPDLTEVYHVNFE